MLQMTNSGSMSIYSIHYEFELLTVLVHQILIPSNTDNASEGMELVMYVP